MTSTSSDVTDLQRMYEEQLLQMALEGHHTAFAELIERSRERCMRIALRLLRNHANAEDEVQNAFCKAYTHLNTFNHEAQFSTWLISILINQCYMRLRRKPRLDPVQIEAKYRDGEADPRWEPVEWRNPEHICAATQIHGLMQIELQRVPYFLRAPVELHVLQELPLEEVARRLQTSVSAVKSRLHRGQRCLRDRMTQHREQLSIGTRIRANQRLHANAIGNSGSGMNTFKSDRLNKRHQVSHYQHEVIPKMPSTPLPQPKAMAACAASL